MRQIIILFGLLFCIGQTGNSQGFGSLGGRVRDGLENFEAAIFVNVCIKKADEVVAGTMTDFDGYYIIKDVPEGIYSIEISSIGVPTVRYTDIIIEANKQNVFDCTVNAIWRTGYGARSIFFYFRLCAFKMSYHLRNELYKMAEQKKT